jgi:hypothetical protein
MNFLILIGQRKERYPGEYAPEALAVIDEVGNEENPDYMREQEAEARGSNEFTSLVVLNVGVDGGTVSRLLSNRPHAIAGQIEEP